MGNQSSFQSDQGRLPMRSFRKGSSSTQRRTAWALTIAAVAYAQGITADLASSQQASGGHRVGILSPYTSSASSFHEDVKRGLTALGYVEGQTVEFESRFANGQTDQIPALAAELVQRRVNVIVTTTTAAVRAAMQSTTTIPIVIGGVDDAVEQGFVATLARPSGNITGTSWLNAELAAKRLDILKEVLPGASRIGVLREAVASGPSARAIMAAGHSLGIQIYLLELRTSNELEDAFSDMVRIGVDALNVLPGPMVANEANKIASLTLQHRIPAIFPDRSFTEAGGLISYGPNLSTMYRRAAAYVDKILKGAKPGDLPVEQPTEFELVVNLKTAQALGLAIPPYLLARADEVIE
jgi:putative ABC transport system substrate-binding protein